VKRTFGLFETGHTVEYCHGWEETGPEKGVDHLFVKHPCFERNGMYGEDGTAIPHPDTSSAPHGPCAAQVSSCSSY
jgi:hypothetical protein